MNFRIFANLYKMAWWYFDCDDFVLVINLERIYILKIIFFFAIICQWISFYNLIGSRVMSCLISNIGSWYSLTFL